MAISNLYITGLPDGVDDEMFRQLFEEYGSGTIVSIKLFAQSNYGFVKYSTVEEAQAVINELNGCIWGNSTLVVKFANKDQGQGGGGAWSGGPGGGGNSSYAAAGGPVVIPGGAAGAAGYSAAGWTGISQPSSSRKGETAVDQVYVKGLPPDFQNDDLYHCFAGYGEVVWHRVLKKAGSDDAAVALVQMATAEEAAWLVENLHGNIPQGLSAPVSVTFSTPPRSKGGGKGSWGSKGGDNSWSGPTVVAPPAHAPAPPATPPPSASGKGSNNGSRSRDRYEPYEYEPFSASVPASQKRSASPEISSPPSPVVTAAPTPKVAPAAPPATSTSSEYNDSSNLYVKGLPKHADELYLYKLFAPFGAITSVRASAADWGTIGFVKFVQAQDAEVAIEQISGQSQPDGSMLQVSVKTLGRGSISQEAA